MNIRVLGFSFAFVLLLTAPLTVGAEETAARKKVDTKSSDTDESRLLETLRRSIADDTKLSPSARRVTLLGDNGTYTLKGTVVSEEEKWEVQRKVGEYVGGCNLRNEIVIKKK